MNGRTSSVAALVFSVCLAGLSAHAAVDAEQAARLGKDLTPIGAERAGNAEGTIPEWKGGITHPPVGYVSGEQHIDPFADDQALTTITPANAQDFAARLGPGQLAMFAKYQSYRMRIFPTRRSAAFPQRIYDYTLKNASSCKLVAGGEGVENCAEGLPFPIPHDAYEVMWNHKLKFKGTTLQRWANQVTPTPSGAYDLVRLREQALAPYSMPGNTAASINNVLLYFFQEIEGPSRLAGNVLLVHETLNAALQPRQAWTYNPGQRRVRLAPQVAYDNPSSASDGLRVVDMTDMFNGALDRFDWKLIGKKEMYVPYNDYAAKAKGVKVADLVRPGHLNPDLLRYELHRVWIVDATLKKDQRHMNSRRTFYLDEDSWQILMVEHYDSQGALWRYSDAPSINYYEVPTFWSTLEVHHDLKSGRYAAGLLDNEEKPFDFSYPTSSGDFSPQKLRERGIR